MFYICLTETKRGVNPLYWVTPLGWTIKERATGFTSYDAAEEKMKELFPKNHENGYVHIER